MLSDPKLGYRETIRTDFSEKLAKNMEKVQKMTSSTKWGASRPIFAGHFLHFFHIFCNFSEKLALTVFYSSARQRRAAASDGR